MTVVLGSVSYAVTTVLILFSAHLSVPQSTAKEAPRKVAPSWEFYNPEVDLLITELKNQKAAVAAKEKQLQELAMRLEAERAEISVVTQAVHRMQIEFDRNIVRVKEEETANLRKLAKVYSGMTPEGAAAILRQMDDDQIVRFMVFMKDADTAPLLESFAKLGEPEAKRAALISERIRTATFRNTTTSK
jgi:flagellar motility protein MotE (MotC chaperone)